MSKKIIVLFLMVAFSVIFLPSTSKAEVVNETTNLINSATLNEGSFFQWRQDRRRNRRWNRRWRNRNNRSNRRYERRNRRYERRENRRDRRYDRRNNRRNRSRY